MEYFVKLDNFEGPLDLLLYLIKKKDLDIYNISISKITTDYLLYIEEMKKLDIYLNGEFLVMASTLLHIKSLLLLPGNQQEEAEELKEELTKKLVEYSKYKAAAQILSQKESFWDNIYTHPNTVIPEEPTLEADIFDLMLAFQNVLARNKSQPPREIAQEKYLVSEKIKQILDLLKEKKSLYFAELFPPKISIRELITIFLALLELVRQAKIYLKQARLFSPIRIYAK